MIFQYDTAFQLVLRLAMRRIPATLVVVIALMFSTGTTLADNTSEVNELFVEAVILVRLAKSAEGYEEKVAVLEEAFDKLLKIVNDYPASDLAVKLISGQRIGAISLDGVNRERIKAEKAAEWERKRPEREARKAREKAAKKAAEEAREKAAKEAQEQGANYFDRFLDDVTEVDVDALPMPLLPPGTIMDLIRTQFSKNWNVPGAPDNDGLVVTVRIRFGRDGTVQNIEILDANYAENPNFRTMVESVRRSIQRASPIKELQHYRGYYNEWRDITVTFDSREMFGW